MTILVSIYIFDDFNKQQTEFLYEFVWWTYDVFLYCKGTLQGEGKFHFFLRNDILHSGITDGSNRQLYDYY